MKSIANHHQLRTQIDKQGHFFLDIDYQDILAAKQVSATLISYDI